MEVTGCWPSLTASLETRYFAPGDPRMKLHKPVAPRSTSSALPPLVQQPWVGVRSHTCTVSGREKLARLEKKVVSPCNNEKRITSLPSVRRAPRKRNRTKTTPAEPVEKPLTDQERAARVVSAQLARQSAASRVCQRRRQETLDKCNQLPQGPSIDRSS